MNDFTLIIPTHNRHNYLRRSISYFKDLNAKVIYCDSSAKRFEGSLNNNMIYLHLPNKDFSTKILEVLQTVDTEFVSMCADDDFILIDSLYDGFFFLNNNKNYKTTVGKYMSFKDVFDGNYYSMYQDLPNDINLEFEKSVEVFFRNYYQILWAMYDKKILVKAFQIINRAKFHNDNFIEMVIGGCVCEAGGIKFLNQIWGVREVSTKEHWGNRHVPITDMKVAGVNGDFKKFEELLDLNTFLGCATLIMNSYLKGQSMVTTRYLKSKISSLIPNFVKTIGKKIIFLKNSTVQTSLSKENNKLLYPITLILNNADLSERSSYVQ